MRKHSAMGLLAGGVCAALLAGLLPGCGSDDTQAPSSEKPRYRVALVMKSLANEFFKTMAEGAKAHEQKDPSRYELITNGMRDENDVASQIAIVDQMIAQKVNALIIAPADSKALVPVCKKAKDAGIVVVNIDNKLDDDALEEKGVRVPFVGPDNRKGARMAGEYLAGKLKAGDQVAIVEGMPGAYNATMRRLGFEAAMDAAGMKIVAHQSGYWEIDKAEKVVAGMLAQHPDLKGILCANDSMALGAVAAIKGAGKTGAIHVVGYDNISAIQQLILDGSVLCTVDQHADQIAIEGIRHALDVLGSHVAPEGSDYKETRTDLIDAEALKRTAEKVAEKAAEKAAAKAAEKAPAK